MTLAPDVEVDTSKLSDENIKNLKKQEEQKDGKKWVSYEIP